MERATAIVATHALDADPAVRVDAKMNAMDNAQLTAAEDAAVHAVQDVQDVQLLVVQDVNMDATDVV